MRELILVTFVVVCLAAVVSGDGYGGHSQVYSVPSGGKGGKWKIKAKGKGMQNLYTHHSGGGGGGHHGGDHGGGGASHAQVVYVPVPMHGGYGGGGHGGGGGGGYESSHKHEISIIPIYGGHGGYGGHSGYGSHYGMGSGGHYEGGYH